MPRLIAVLFALLIAAPAPAAEPKPTRITNTYDVADLLDKRTDKSGVGSIDEIIKLIAATINPKGRLTDPDNAVGFGEVNGTKLQVTATQAEHDEIKDLLAALRRLNDVAVDVRATFLAVDPKWFAKEVRPHLGEKLPSGLGVEKLDELKKYARVVHANKLRLGNGREGAAASLRRAVVFPTIPTDGGGEPGWGVEFAGIAYRIKPVVSADRRFVRFAIDERLKEQDAARRGDAELRMKETKSKSEIQVEDGEPVVLAVPYTPKEVKGEGKILLLLIESSIYVEAEEKERRGTSDG